MTLPSQEPDLERETSADREAAQRRLTMDYPVQLETDPEADQLRRDAGLDTPAQ